MQIETILERHYAIKNAGINSLEGYDSVNYKIICDQGIFVLKQYSNTEENRALLSSENRILTALTSLKQYDFSTPLAALTNEFTVIEGDYLYRLLSFVEGDFLGDVDHSKELLESLGILLAHTDKCTVDLYEPVIAAKETQWDLKHFKTNHTYLKYINDSKDRNLVDYFFMQFDEYVYPVQHQLRKGIIYNDANHWNVLTKQGKVSGIIDFGDMCHSWVINEVAIALTYVMMEKENPLEIASEVLRGYHSIFPLEAIELELLYYLVAARLCTSVCNSAYAKTLKPDSEYITISEKPAWDLLHKWVAINPIKANDLFRAAVGLDRKKRKTTDEQLRRRNTNFSASLSLSYKNPIHMHQSAFQYMYDAEGNTFLDAYNNIMLAGHCHPKVVKAGQQSMAKLNTNTRYLYEELLQYSEKLLVKFPARLNKVFFVNSGSAASDLAVRLVTSHTKRQKMMVLEHGYHGNTRMAIDLSHYKYNHQNGTGKKANIIETPMPKAFRSGYSDDGTAGEYFAKQAIEQIRIHNGEIGAFIAEPIVGCGGQVPLAKGYLKHIYAAIRAQGGLCISDEVQVGFGRLGDYFWGYEMHDVEPDLVIIGKPMGNGHPIGAVVTTEEVAKSFEEGPEFFSSFGGNPVSCAIGNAVLEVIEEEKLQQHAKAVGDYLKDKLSALQIEYPEIADVRGNGLFLGVEILTKQGEPNTDFAAKIKNELRNRHILISTDGPFDNVLKIKPPLSFNRDNADTLVNEIALCLT